MQRSTRLKRLFETRESRIGMNQYDVEEFIRDGRRAIVVLLLIWSFTDENVAQAANDERASLRRPRRLQQGHELTRKLLTPEWKQLDQHHRRPQFGESRRDELA